MDQREIETAGYAHPLFWAPFALVGDGEEKDHESAASQPGKTRRRARDGALLRFSLGNEYLKAGALEQAAAAFRLLMEQGPNYSAAWKPWVMRYQDRPPVASTGGVPQHLDRPGPWRYSGSEGMSVVCQPPCEE